LCKDGRGDCDLLGSAGGREKVEQSTITNHCSSYTDFFKSSDPFSPTMIIYAVKVMLKVFECPKKVVSAP